MEHIGWISHIAANPVGYLLAKTALYFGIIAPFVCFAEIFQSGVSPVTHRNHHILLEHFEVAGFVELQTPLPCIPKTIWPFTRMTIALVPDVFLGPEPALFAKSKDEFEHINMTLAAFGLLFDVQNKSPSWLKDSTKFCAALHKPVHILIRLDATVGILALVRVRW